ncbi:MAG: methyltransferase domain-containing protein, partial [Nitrospirae bacterium]|nr:methyltransferase domain-containing protein [Nitrospirota bacterium]
MSPIDPKQYINQQRQDWNRVAPAWEKWDHQLDQNLSFISHRLIGDARLSAGQRVLDLGCGTGYPAILAAQAVGGHGRVIAIDLSDGMLAIARRKAEEAGLSNILFQSEDATTLPFDSDSFDAVISRFCLMFLPEIPRAVAEVARVLKSGGYIAAAVWSTPDKNPFLRIPIDIIKRFIEVPAPAPDQPGIFRLAKPKDLLGIMEGAGLHGIADEEVAGESLFETAEEYLANIKELAAP